MSVPEHASSRIAPGSNSSVDGHLPEAPRSTGTGHIQTSPGSDSTGFDGNVFLSPITQHAVPSPASSSNSLAGELLGSADTRPAQAGT